MVAPETFVCYWLIQIVGLSGKYSRNFNRPNSGSGSAPVTIDSRLMREFLSPTLDALATGKHSLNVGVIRGSEVKRVGADIIVTPSMQMRDSTDYNR